MIDERVAARLRDWSRVLAERDMAALVAVIDAESGLTARVLAHPDGERTMTDLRQLAGELTVQQRETRWGATALLDWLELQSQRTAEDGREQTMARTRRLESDADAVQIITIHRAKGLEFPVTYVPFGWDRPVFSEKTDHQPRRRSAACSTCGRRSPTRCGRQSRWRARRSAGSRCGCSTWR